MDGVQITFVNQSNDMNNSSVVIFQKNVATNFDELAVAWRVIENCGRGWTHEFVYPMQFQVGARDSWGNMSNLEYAVNGQSWAVDESPSGSSLSLTAQASSSSTEVEVRNLLNVGSTDACIFRDGRLLACKTGVSPQQKAVFEFKPTIWVGVVSQIEEGEFINSAILSSVNQSFSLLGLNKAQLILTGGGSGPNAQPYKFTLVPQ